MEAAASDVSSKMRTGAGLAAQIIDDVHEPFREVADTTEPINTIGIQPEPGTYL